MNQNSLQRAALELASNPNKNMQRRPGPGRPTREQAELRSIELLEKALELFLENGFERTTMEGIAADVGMAKRTVYGQYGDKLTLFKAALRRAINEWIIPVEQLRAVEEEDLEQTLLKIGQLLVENIVTPEGIRLLRITNAEASRLPEISNYTYQQGTGPTLEYLADLFSRRLGGGSDTAFDSRAAARAFLTFVVGGAANISVWGIDPDKEGVGIQTDYNVRLFLHGIFSDRFAGPAS